MEIGEPFGAKEDQNIWDVAKLASSYKIRVYFIMKLKRWIWVFPIQPSHV